MKLTRPVSGLLGAVIALALALAGLGGYGIYELQPSDPTTDTDQIASQFSVTIHWSKKLTCGTVDAGGCTFAHSTKDIYVLGGLPAEQTRSVILHEIGHVMQNRLGQPADECKADEFARSLGATWFGYDC
jgi:hypothetical protein